MTWRTYLSASLQDFNKIWANPDAAQQAVKDENLFAAIIILRVLEEMDGLCPPNTALPLLDSHS